MIKARAHGGSENGADRAVQVARKSKLPLDLPEAAAPCTVDQNNTMKYIYFSMPVETAQRLTTARERQQWKLETGNRVRRRRN